MRRACASHRSCQRDSTSAARCQAPPCIALCMRVSRLRCGAGVRLEPIGHHMCPGVLVAQRRLGPRVHRPQGCSECRSLCCYCPPNSPIRLVDARAMPTRLSLSHLCSGAGGARWTLSSRNGRLARVLPSVSGRPWGIRFSQRLAVPRECRALASVALALASGQHVPAATILCCFSPDCWRRRAALCLCGRRSLFRDRRVGVVVGGGLGVAAPLSHTFRRPGRAVAWRGGVGENGGRDTRTFAGL